MNGLGLKRQRCLNRIFHASLGRMKIVLATPLYPPDIAEPAPYIKELANRLKNEHEVTIVTYGNLPEKIEGVKIISVSKHTPLPVRLFSYTVTLMKAAWSADVLYAQNGPSVELPVSFVTVLLRKRLVFRIGDKVAHEYAKKHHWRRQIEGVAVKHAEVIFNDSPLSRPEILPLESYPATAFDAYQTSWGKHVAELSKILSHV